ncbi:hypothetical protein [Kaistella carnis]|uniref:Uncharacterized protein n=1 Tax=Kaistella carnis TaxID=1241979 RepID=A0A3G8XM66_9FLAO|nr:hypothetical protein [Kaistella carnis]AZI33643.1 hypothetical protein EIB73_10805 [Kaistella carnis]
MNIEILFQKLFYDEPQNIDYYLESVFGLLHDEASKRGIEFEGYFITKWTDSANTIINFDEEYFSNLDRRNLYVYKASASDPEIFTLLQKAYKIAKLRVPQINDIHREIFEHGEKGVKF